MVHFRMTYNNAELKHPMSQYIVAQNCGRTLHIHVIDHLFFRNLQPIGNYCSLSV